ncbi:ferritin-like domain-containing protein [Bacillus sp. FJAT-49736]|nr:ferritin-like domain-containing protein [Bacillus sp. FJAT-49736]
MSDLSKAINGEYEAIQCYEYLINQTTNPEIREQLIEIRNDEICHYETFYNLYLSLTNTHPPVSMTKKCPPDFKSGIIAAFKDEQNTTDFYHAVARNIKEKYLKEPFQQAALDEQNHAVWFLYFMRYI